jgi:uncharacterized membrane protein
MSSKGHSEKTFQRWTKLMRLGHLAGCHQMASRSFHIHGMQCPLCARCSGLLIGEVMLAPLYILLVPQVWWINLLLVLPLSIDGIGQYLGFWLSNNIRRLVTGLLGGIGLIALAFQGIMYLVDQTF